MMRLHQFTARTLRGEDVPLSYYHGRVALVVNTASKCGFTPQYRGLDELYQKYRDQGLVVLGFPCNQFGNQEPGDSHSIQSGCLLNYGVTFPMFEKVEVRGPGAHPLFTWLSQESPGLLGASIKWNFTKFLLDQQGKPVRRFAPVTKPERIEESIRQLLGL